jgi:hypothetical protein
MSFARPHGLSDAARQDDNEPQSVATAVQVVAAWLVAFICVALLGLLS